MQTTVDLSAYIGTTVEVRFKIETDISVISSMFIDDVVLDVCEPIVVSCTPPLTIPTAIDTYTADMECTDAMGWTHYWKNAATAPVTATDILLLSIEKDGTVDISPSQVSIGVTGVGGSVDLSGLSYVTDPVGWFVMNRYWNVSPTTQPGASGVNIRFYYTTDDYDGVSTAVTTVGGTISSHADLFFYKFQSGSGINPDPTTNHAGGNNSNYLEFQGAYSTYNTDHLAQFNVSGFSGGGGGAGGSGAGALPVELTHFQAAKEGKTALLTWQTAGEINNRGFHIEYSMNGKDFERIGWVDGAGSVAISQAYRHLHETPNTGINYYRLMQEDFDGTLRPSDVKTILFDTKFALSIFPNPSKRGQATTLQLLTQNTQEIQIVVYDATGKKVLNRKISAEKGANTLSLSQENLSNGVYFMSVTHDAGTDNLKFSIME